ncbi:MAG: 2-(1,2-epoxy,2-dihydrophenyl)acetyl-CoA isomerase [Frankiales bacterium]|nr:2-(1,2-epoxy,2-dihydrophenyl)acetyl-CoA isomerase [Frankiales bacterium]
MTSLRYEVRDGAAYLTLCRPDRGNPVDLTLARELRDAVEQARNDDVRVVVLDHEGKAFSVGGDIAAFGASEDPSALINELASTLHEGVLGLTQLDAIVVSVVRGTAAGAGFPLAAAADLVLASEGARFTLAYTRIGLTPDGGSSLLTTTVGLHRVLHWVLLNPLLSAADLQAAGIVAQVHAADALDAAVQEVVGQLLAGSRDAQVAAKHLLRSKVAPDAQQALDNETAGITVAAGGPDGREGVRAFLDKRAARFPSAT